ncbi:MAG: phosphoesterase, partial [Phaeodactylibacter sp.]|nr:phosphoesterase [Phaeodactylibacter sp.]
MKHILFPSAILLALFLFSSCQKELPTQLDYSDYAFASLDEDGGTWTPILLSASDQIAVPVPEDPGSAAYQEELSALKAAASDLSTEQMEAIDYWTNNPALRWNEIALELVAKYNLIPGPNPDGSYTLPNPADPGATPNFPFSHPPYAVRALAYLSVAQFDGLITAWHYKYLYNRPAPSLTDSSIPAAWTENDLPSYPADGAVIAAASRAILTAMFPLEKDYLEAREEEQLASLQWAGAHVESDIEAGVLIGEET